MMLRGLTANNGPHLLLLWSQCECHAKNAMSGQFRGRNRGEFLLRYKAVFYCRPMPEQGQNTSSSRNTNFWKGEAGANKVSGGSELSFPRNQFERRPKTPAPLSRSNDRFRHLGTNFQTWSGRGGEQKEGRREGRRFSRSLESGTTPHQPRVFTFIELGGERRGGVNRNPSLSLSLPPLLIPLCLPGVPALSFL